MDWLSSRIVFWKVKIEDVLRNVLLIRYGFVIDAVMIDFVDISREPSFALITIIGKKGRVASTSVSLNVSQLSGMRQIYTSILKEVDDDCKEK